MKLISSFAALITLASSVSLPVAVSETLDASLVERQAKPNGTHSCKITGNAYVNCHYCYLTSCDVVKVLNPGQAYNFDCVCPNGECFNGLCSWDHSPDQNCWVFANTTDYNCPTTGSNALPECAFCGK